MGASINHVDMDGRGQLNVHIAMRISLRYLVKWPTKGGGIAKNVQKLSTWFMDDSYLEISSIVYTFLLLFDIAMQQ